ACGHSRENVRSKDLLNSEFRPEFLRLGDDVVLHEPVSLVLVSSNEDRLASQITAQTISQTHCRKFPGLCNFRSNNAQAGHRRLFRVAPQPRARSARLPRLAESAQPAIP